MIQKHYKTNDFYRSYTPTEVGQVYSQSKIVFNTSIAGDVTMRIFEGTASAALLLTDPAQNGLNELFTIGKEIVVYENDDDLLKKIDYYLAHDDERCAIAQAGYTQTLKAHTYQHRVKQIGDCTSC